MKYSPQPSLRARWLIPWLLTLAIVIVVSGSITHLLTESWWFNTVDYAGVFWTRIQWQLVIGLGTFLLYGAVLAGNYGLAQKITRDRPYTFLHRYSDRFVQERMARLPSFGAFMLILVVSLGAAFRGAGSWETILKFLNPTQFDIADPIYQHDISFYIFRLPFYQGLQTNLMGLLFWSLVLTMAVYALKGEIRPERGWKYFLTGEAKTHLCLLLALIALAIAVGFWIKRFSLLYSSSGVVFGAGYTDVHARLQSYWLMGFVSLAVAFLFIVGLWRSGFSLPSFGILIYLGLLVIVNGLYPWFQQNFVVEPNQLVKERPYIENNIDFTRHAYNLNQVTAKPFEVETRLNRQVLAANQATVSNIRLWDYRPLLSTYRQLQEIRLYYRFWDVDIDRYTLNGDYRQVMTSARELSADALPAEAQTWINQQLKFTHGYGIVMSPVNEVTPDGLPKLLIKNIPPVSEVDLTIDQPRIYYGEETTNYIFTGTNTDEFDYPLGDENATYRYTGKGGVPIGSLLRKLAYAYDLGNLRLLISNYFTPDTRIHYHRSVQERIHQVAPFLAFDSDPYITVIDGRLYWIVDGYTTSNRYPYAEPLNRTLDIDTLVGTSTNLASLTRQGINYMRDSVKVFIDAYDGSMRFFAIDEQDPILATYRKIFPQLVEPANAMPANFRRHLRYPHDFFKIQAQIYRAYHMANAEVFYNQEDLWRFPSQVYEGNPTIMDPYYLIMSLPDFNGAELVQILPFTPANKDNMIAWMAGGSDGDNYGKLLLYEFPKQELVYGPSQIEARIDQTPEISEQLTLWSQQGSRVIRGDLLVIPIERSLLYVEPVYLRAEQGELPELKRVIVAYGNQVVMRENLEQCLEAIFGEAAASPVPNRDQTTTTASLPADVAGLIQSALETYQAGQTALEQGDWQRYGDTQQRLETILEQLNQQNK